MTFVEDGWLCPILTNSCWRSNAWMCQSLLWDSAFLMNYMAYATIDDSKQDTLPCTWDSKSKCSHFSFSVTDTVVPNVALKNTSTYCQWLRWYLCLVQLDMHWTDGLNVDDVEGTPSFGLVAPQHNLAPFEAFQCGKYIQWHLGLSDTTLSIFVNHRTHS